MSKIRRASALIPTPKAFVRSVLSKLTLPCGALWTKRPGVATPYWSHALLDYIMVIALSPELRVDVDQRVFCRTSSDGTWLSSATHMPCIRIFVGVLFAKWSVKPKSSEGRLPQCMRRSLKIPRSGRVPGVWAIETIGVLLVYTDLYVFHS